MKPTTPKLIQPPTTTSRDFVRKVMGFSVGVGVGMAPFLGAVDIRGFKALYSVLPFQIRFGLVAFSAFIMGLIAMAVQFYVAGKISLPALGRRFKLGLIAMFAGLVAFVVVWNEFTVRVPRGDDNLSVMIGSARLQGCDCASDVGDVQCIEDLSFDEAAIESCWGSRPLRRIGLFFILAYLALTSGFAFLVSLLVLQQEAIRRARQPGARRPTVRLGTRRRRTPPPPSSGDAA